MKRHDVLLLLSAQIPHVKIAEVTGVPLRTIERWSSDRAALAGLEREDAETLVSREPAGSRGPGRPSKTGAWRDAVSAMLSEEPKLKSLEVLRRLRLLGYDGGKSAAYALVRELRPKQGRLVQRFEGLAGEFSQHDFGQVRVAWVGGGEARIRFFASSMKFSRYRHVALVADETVESVVRGLIDFFNRMDGIPLLAVFDRPTTVVQKWDTKTGEAQRWNPVFADVMSRLGLGAELCWPRRANQKGQVENLVGWVKNSFFKVRRFHGPEDMQHQLADWLHEINFERPCRATGAIPATRLEEERPRLRPLRVRPADLDLVYPAMVGPTGMVPFQGHLYSMPPDAASCPATVHLFQDRIRIAAGRHQAVHPRFDRNSEPQVSTLSEHRALRLSKVSGRRGRQYMMREQLLELGADAEAVITEIVHRSPVRWNQEIVRLHDLLSAHGDDAMRAAFRNAAAGHARCAADVARCLPLLALSRGGQPEARQ